jgi:transposase
MRCSSTWGKKGVSHALPIDPPRERAEPRPGHGTWQNDRPPLVGLFGRISRRLHLKVVHRLFPEPILNFVEERTPEGCIIFTDEFPVYEKLPTHGRAHASVRHRIKEYARDDDGDGVREVHCNTCEGLWSGLRTFLRRFRGVNKVYLGQYAAIFEWGFNLKRATDEFLRILLGRPATTKIPT